VFLVSDTVERRHQKIRSFLPREPVVAILLANVDFEWTVRRAIIALGVNSNKVIREEVLSKCHGPEQYKDAWKVEVKARFAKGLPEVVTNWQDLKLIAFKLRGQVVHGVNGMPSSKKTAEAVEMFLKASNDINKFAATKRISLFGKRLPVRRKARK
jgi:hypothetical protein